MSMPFQPLPCAGDDPVVVPEPCCSPGIASTGLCLGDGTPIAVLAVSACAECGAAAAAPTVSGWINLLTGAFTPGAPPAGTEPCLNQPQQFENAQWCDLDGAGEVIAPVLVEYEYDENGQLINVRTLTPAGDPYAVVGTLGLCPGPVNDVEYKILCDVQGDGTVVRFLRGYVPNGDGTATADDITLDGATYTPTGTVQACEQAEVCRDTAPTLLCDVVVTESETIFDPQNIAGADGWEVVAFVPTAPGGFPAAGPLPYPAFIGINNHGQQAMGARADLRSSNTVVVWPGYDNAVGRWILRKTFNAPEDGTAVVTAELFRADGGGRVRVNGIDLGLYSQWGQPGTSGTFTAPVTAGPNTIEIEVRDDWGWNWVTGRLDVATTRSAQFLRRNVYDCVSGEIVDTIDTTLDGLPYTVTGEVGECVPVTGCCPETPGQSVAQRELCDDNDGTITRFLRAYVYPDGSSSPITVDTLLDGVTPYISVGTVGTCDIPCAAAVDVQRLCDLNPGVEPDDEGRRCATPFLRTLVYDCAGDLTATRDTTMDGVTPYTPVQVVDCQCGAGGAVPSLVELVWPQTDVIADPDGVADHDYIYLLTNPQTGDTAEIRLNTVTAPTAGTCGAWTPGNNVAVNAPAGNPSGNSRFTFTLDAAAQEMSSFRLDFLDLDPFEGVRSLTPPPDRVEFSVGAGTWTPGSGNISATVANSTAHAYWDNPPATITHLYANNGGGIACHAAALQGVTLIPGECCGGESTTDTPLRLGAVCYDDGAGGTRTAAVVRCAGCGDAAVSYLDVETGAEVAAPTIVPCPSEAASGVDVETFPLCVLNADGSVVQHIRAEQVYDADGNAVGPPRMVDAVTGGPVAMPGGTHIGVCPDTAAAAEGMVTVLDECRCDDVAGDGSVIARYVELIGVNSDGSLTSLGYWTEDFTSPYDPVSPIPCPGGGADPVVTVQAHRVELAAGGTWDVAAWPTLQSVTAVAHGGTGTVTTDDGASTLFEGESVTWSVARDVDSRLVGPLAVEAVTGVVTVAWTTT